MTRNTFATLALAAGTVFAATSASQAVLVHRYNLNGNANDSVGTSNGTLLGNGTFSATGLVTTGTNSATTGVLLPASTVAGITGSFTIQQFYTTSAAQGNFAVGSSFSDRNNASNPVDPTGTTNFVIFQPRRGDAGNPSSFAVIGPQTGGQKNSLGATADTPGTVYNALYSYDAGAQTGSYYLNGVLQGTPLSLGLNLSTKNGLIGINGSGPFVNDPGLNGTTDDFRIFNNSVTAAQAFDAELPRRRCQQRRRQRGGAGARLPRPARPRRPGPPRPPPPHRLSLAESLTPAFGTD